MLKDTIFRRFLQLPIAQKAALITACCCLIATLILIAASHQGNRQLIQRSSELFGDSLGQQLARDASNPLVQGDKLSLQSLLNKLVESPLVVAAVIYDIENHSIAEAGQHNAQGQSLSASITFQDSIAGYAVLTLDTTPLTDQLGNNSWQLSALALLLAVLAYLLSLLPAGHVSAALKDLQVLGSTPRPLRSAHRQIAYRGEDELQHLAHTLINGPVLTPEDEGVTACEATTVTAIKKPIINSNRAILAIALYNLPTLLQQRSQAHTDKLLADLYQQLQRVCNLYEGELSINRENGFSLQFSALNDDQSYPFRAVCSGYLLTQWRNQQTSPLVIAAGLAVYEVKLNGLSDSKLLMCEQALLAQAAISRAYTLATEPQQLCVASDIVNHNSVQQRVQLSEHPTDNQRHMINCLTAPYNELLQRQLSALQAQALH